MTDLAFLAANVSTAPGRLDPIQLFLDADIVVQVVMAGLLLASVWVWAIILSFRIRIGGVRKRCDEFESEFFQLDNLIAPGGDLPLNTSGGNLAECYMHGLGLNLEAVRQIRRTSTGQVPHADVSMVISGPMVTPVSSCIFGSEATL